MTWKRWLSFRDCSQRLDEPQRWPTGPHLPPQIELMTERWMPKIVKAGLAQ
jgi:hypothetical protein